jgi:hypothetical protein
MNKLYNIVVSTSILRAEIDLFGSLEVTTKPR